MSYTVKGLITGIQDIQEFDAGSKKVTFQIDTQDQYNNIYSFELFKGAEHAVHVDNFVKYNKVNDNVSVEFNVKTNEWQGKFYTSLSVWKVEKLDQTQNAQNEDVTDDLPFRLEFSVS